MLAQLNQDSIVVIGIRLLFNCQFSFFYYLVMNNFVFGSGLARGRSSRDETNVLMPGPGRGRGKILGENNFRSEVRITKITNHREVNVTEGVPSIILGDQVEIILFSCSSLVK